MCEKLACAVLAGMPVYSKPATATAVVAERIVALWHDAGVLPTGIVSLHCGSAGDLLDHLNAQDCIVFTGSGDTALKIRGHQNVLRQNIPVNVEADSLNAAILGPDISPDSDTFQMFLGDVADITQRPGKCTAVRRIIVSESQFDFVAEALIDRLERRRG